MDRSELIDRWLQACELAKKSNTYDKIVEINAQVERFVMTGMLPWENSLAGASPDPVIIETRVGFCPTPEAKTSGVPYGSL